MPKGNGGRKLGRENHRLRGEKAQLQLKTQYWQDLSSTQADELKQIREAKMTIEEDFAKLKLERDGYRQQAEIQAENIKYADDRHAEASRLWKHAQMGKSNLSMKLIIEEVDVKDFVAGDGSQPDEKFVQEVRDKSANA
jgi:hypothetical protein